MFYANADRESFPDRLVTIDEITFPSLHVHILRVQRRLVDRAVGSTRNTLVAIRPLESKGDKSADTHESSGDSKSHDILRGVLRRPDERPIDRREVTETVDDGDGDTALLAAVEHGDHPAEEDGDGRPYARATEADEGVAHGKVVCGSADDEGYGTPYAGDDDVVGFLAGTVGVP